MAWYEGISVSDYFGKWAPDDSAGHLIRRCGVTFPSRGRLLGSPSAREVHPSGSIVALLSNTPSGFTCQRYGSLLRRLGECRKEHYSHCSFRQPPPPTAQSAHCYAAPIWLNSRISSLPLTLPSGSIGALLRCCLYRKEKAKKLTMQICNRF